jgi:cell division protein FtsW
MATPQPAAVSRPRSLLNPATIILVCAIGLTLLGLTILFSASASMKEGTYFISASSWPVSRRRPCSASW